LNLSANLHITPKGEDEIKRRVYKLDMKKRSLLILLDKPRTIDYLTRKTILRLEEFLAEINSLIQDGFVSPEGSATAHISTPAPAPKSAPSPAICGASPATSGAQIQVSGDIVISEAKFLLTNFCVDGFGTQSQAFVDAIRACKNAQDIWLQSNAIFAAAKEICPNQLPNLLNVIKEINATA
jgi:hypothetical protein